MDYKEKPIKKLNLKECRSALRKLNRTRNEVEEEIGFFESHLYSLESDIREVKDRIKKLKPKTKD